MIKPIQELFTSLKTIDNDILVSKVRKGKYVYKYLHIYSGFDIETTNIVDEKGKRAYMYIWQFSFNGQAYYSRTWDDFTTLLQLLKYHLKLTPKKRIIIWVANLSFEFQFFRKKVNVTEIFAKEKREPLLVVVDECIEFRECLSISGGSLEQLAKDYTKTQKLVGDLDYNLYRHSFTELTEKELAYCENDVIILSEFSEHMFETYISEGYIPMTKTAILRKKVKKAFEEFAIKNFGKYGIEILHDYIKGLYPKDKETYSLLMNYLFRGGFTHGDCVYATQTLSNVICHDFTSSYPAVMQKEYFPMTEFKLVQNCILEQLEELCKTHCVYFLADFTNIKNKTHHSIESLNKCLEIEGELIDNGRIVSARKMSVLLTELDFLSYKDFYAWDNIDIHYVHIAERGKLPKYILIPMLNDYVAKAILKEQGKSDTAIYNITKAMVNSYYGMTVTRLVDKDVIYNDDNWNLDNTNFDYNKEISKQFLSPFWGIYVTAHARRNELYMLKQFDNVGRAYYCDTDSIFHDDTIELNKIVDEWNVSRETFNKEFCKKNGYDFKYLFDLGCMDIDKKCDNFKYLGAKRYIYQKGERVFNTIAGLKKNIDKNTSMIEHLAKLNNTTPFDFFKDGMKAECEESKKLASAYIDEYTSDLVTDYNGVSAFMEEDSCVCLYPIEFNLKMAKEYVSLILKSYEKEKRRI